MRLFTLLFLTLACTCVRAQAVNSLPTIDDPQDADRIDTYTRGFAAAFRLDTLKAYFSDSTLAIISLLPTDTDIAATLASAQSYADANDDDTNYWTLSGGNVYRNSKVGINVSSPGEDLEVSAGGTNFAEVAISTESKTDGAGIGRFSFQALNTSDAELKYAGIRGAIVESQAGAEIARIAIEVQNDGSLIRPFTVVGNRVGIVSEDPTMTLDVDGGAKIRDTNQGDAVSLIGRLADGTLTDAANPTIDEVLSSGNTTGLNFVTSGNITSTTAIFGSTLPITLVSNFMRFNNAGGVSYIEQSGDNGSIRLRHWNNGSPINNFDFTETLNKSYLPLDMSLEKITELANGTLSDDAVNLSQLNAAQTAAQNYADANDEDTNYWTLSGGNVYRNSKVGINVSSPDEDLEVSAGGTNFPEIAALTERKTDGQGIGRFSFQAFNTADGKVKYAGFRGEIVESQSGQETGRLDLEVQNEGSLINAFSVVGDKVGIGSESPTMTLDVDGGAKIRDTNQGTSVSLIGRLANGTLTDAANPTIDVATFDGANLNLSLSGDGEATKVVDLSSLQDGPTRVTRTSNLTRTSASVATDASLTTASLVAGLYRFKAVLVYRGSDVNTDLEYEIERTFALNDFSMSRSNDATSVRGLQGWPYVADVATTSSTATHTVIVEGTFYNSLTNTIKIDWGGTDAVGSITMVRGSYLETEKID
jgi:hypothetical protein